MYRQHSPSAFVWLSTCCVNRASTEPPFRGHYTIAGTVVPMQARGVHGTSASHSRLCTAMRSIGAAGLASRATDLVTAAEKPQHHKHKHPFSTLTTPEKEGWRATMAPLSCPQRPSPNCIRASFKFEWKYRSVLSEY